MPVLPVPSATEGSLSKGSFGMTLMLILPSVALILYLSLQFLLSL